MKQLTVDPSGPIDFREPFLRQVLQDENIHWDEGHCRGIEDALVRGKPLAIVGPPYGDRAPFTSALAKWLEEEQFQLVYWVDSKKKLTVSTFMAGMLSSLYGQLNVQLSARKVPKLQKLATEMQDFVGVIEELLKTYHRTVFIIIDDLKGLYLGMDKVDACAINTLILKCAKNEQSRIRFLYSLDTPPEFCTQELEATLFAASHSVDTARGGREIEGQKIESSS